MFEPAVPEPTAETSRLTRAPAAKSQLAAVSVPSSEVPAAAIENAAATSEPTLRSAVSAEPAGAVVTATVAPVIFPAKGIAIVTMLLVANTPAMFIVIVVGASSAVDIFSPIGHSNYDIKKVLLHIQQQLQKFIFKSFLLTL
jgi:hypothetical protein